MQKGSKQPGKTVKNDCQGVVNGDITSEGATNRQSPLAKLHFLRHKRSVTVGPSFGNIKGQFERLLIIESRVAK
jgi:hypothetical protein